MRKFPEVLNHKEKREFIETLLVIAGIFTALNQSVVLTFPVLLLFIVASLVYIIRNSIAEKSPPGKMVKHNFLLSISVASGFSGVLLTIGVPYFRSFGWLFGSLSAITLYGLLVSLLTIILNVEKPHEEKKRSIDS